MDPAAQPSQADTPPAPTPGACRRRTVAWIAVWLLAIGVAAVLDPHVSAWAKRFGDEVYSLKAHERVADVLKAPGEVYFALGAAALAIWLHPWKWRAGGLICLTIMIGGLIEILLKWTVGRRRPKLEAPYEFSVFVGGWGGLFGRESNLTFPSGHATCAFATAAALATLFPRWRWAFYGLATVTAAERVVERAHYLSDVVAAAGIGILCVRVAAYLGNKLVNREPPLETACQRVEAEPAPRTAGQP